MAYNPGVSFFIPFYELDPSKQSQCIYFTQKGPRCRWRCHESDNRQAIALHKTIIANSSEVVSLNLLQDYVLCNCCRSGNARHRDRIEDVGLWIPLARRWQDEIWRRAADQSNHTPSVQALEESTVIPYAYNTLVTSPSSHTTTLYNSTASPSYYQSSAQTSFSINSTPFSSPSPYQFGSPKFSTTPESAFQPFESQPRYNLRPREANTSTNSTSTQPTSISLPPQSEFRPHVVDPIPSDSVSWKILDPLEGRDFEIGSLYVFDRASSPGHVKIGWTARSVSRRLEDWSECGYDPNLLFSVHRVPHAQRAETLTHHELLKEWRRERMCKGCFKSHQEWFEISKERAAQVLSDWAEFMKKAEPYDSKGWLKNWWKKVIKMMDWNGELVTAKKLLEHYEASWVEEATLIEEPADLGHRSKIEEEEDFRYGLKAGNLEARNEALGDVDSQQIEQPTLPKETPLLKSEALPKPTPLMEIPPPKAEKQRKSDQLFEIEPLSKAVPSFKEKSLSKSEPVHVEVLAPERLPVKKELSPEQIPLPSSPLLQSTTFPQDILSSQEKKSGRSTRAEKASAIHIITNSDTKITAVDISFNPEINSLVSASAPTSLSAIISPSTKLIEEILQTNTYARTDTSITTKSPPLNFSDPSSKLNRSESSAASASLRPKAEPVSDPLAPLVTEILEAPLFASTDEQEEEVAETLTLIMQRQQIVEDYRQAEPKSKLLRCDRQKLDEETKSHDQDKSTATDNKTGTGADGWDADETIAEDQATMSLEKAALKIVDGLYNEISSGEGNGVLKSLNGLKVQETETPPAVEVVVQA